MSSTARVSAAESLEHLLPELTRDFLQRGPLQNVLPPDIRLDILTTYTDVLARAVRQGNGGELVEFIEQVVWEARKMGVAPVIFMEWIDRYQVLVDNTMGLEERQVIDPYLMLTKRHIERLQN